MTEAPMNQQVDVTLKLSLWLDATMDEDDVVTHVRASLPKAFGEELTAMKNPVDILEVRQEAEIYGNAEPASVAAPFAVYQLANDPDTYGADAGKFIVTSADLEHEYSGPMSEKDAKAFARVLAALDNCARLLADHDESEGEEGEAYREALAAVAEATGRAA